MEHSTAKSKKLPSPSSTAWYDDSYWRFSSKIFRSCFPSIASNLTCADSFYFFSSNCVTIVFYVYSKLLNIFENLSLLKLISSGDQFDAYFCMLFSSMCRLSKISVI